MALDSKKIVCFLRNGIVVLSVFCYRFARAHPIISFLLCSFGVLYVVEPEVFFFLVSSSPVLISTALLLGALLSLGQPHIPQIDDIEEEENVEASSKSNEDVDEDKKNKVKETTDNDLSQSESTDDNDDAIITENLKGKIPTVRGITVTQVSRRRFEEGIDDFSTRRYLDAESLLGKRTEIVETIEEEEEQFNSEDVEDNRHHIRNEVVGQRDSLISTLKEEGDEVVEIENKAAVEEEAALQTDVHKDEENIVLGEETSEKSQEKTTDEVAERRGIQSMEKDKGIQMENHPISDHLDNTETVIEGSDQKPAKEIAETEEEMPLTNHPSSSSLKLDEEISDPRTLDTDFCEQFLKSKGSEAEVEISNREEENAQKAPFDEFFSLSLQSSWKRFAHHHTFSDSGSDRAESSSADASLGDLGPMFDELHPLLDFEAPKTGSVSDSCLEESELIHEEEFSPRERASEDLIVFPDEPRAQSSVHEEEEEDEQEEEEEEEENVPIDFGFTWTEDDEKNLMDLGYSERERMQVEEKMIALRHAQHHQEPQEENLIDFFSEERASCIEEENLVEIGLSGNRNVKKGAEIQSDLADQSDSGHKEITTEIPSDSAGEEKLIKSTEENSSVDHITEQIQKDLLLQEDQSRGLEAVCLSENLQEEINIEASSIESTLQNFIKEDSASKREESQVGSPKASLQSVETVELVELDSPPVIDMRGESLPDVAKVASIEEEQSKTEGSEETSDHSSSSSSSEKNESTTVDAIAEELTSKHREICLNFPKDSEQCTEIVEAIEPDSAHAMEIQRDTVLAIRDVASTEERQLKEEKTDEPSDYSSSSASDKFISTRKIIPEDSTIKHDEIQVGSPKASWESTETVVATDLDSPPVMEMQRDSIPALVEFALIGKQESNEEKIEESADDSSCEPRMTEIIAEDSASKHEEDQVDSPLRVSQQFVQTVEAIELSSPLRVEVQRDSAPTIAAEASTEEQHSKEEGNEEPFDDSTSSASEEMESTHKDAIAEESLGKAEEIQGASTKASEEPTDLHSHPLIGMHGDNVPRVKEEAPTEAWELKLEETEKPSDDSNSSASDVSGSESQQKLIILEAHCKEEIESAIKDVVAEELARGQEEVRDGSPKVSLESAEIIEEIEPDSPLEAEITRDSAPTVADVDSTREQQSNTDETKKPCDDSSSSASDISTVESLQELTILEVKSKEDILSAFKEIIAEESTNKHEGIQVGSSQVPEQVAETVTEPTKLDSPQLIEMHRDSLPATLEVASIEDNQSKPEETEELLPDVRHYSSGGGEIP